MTLTFDEKTRLKMFRHNDGHVHIWVPIICEGSTDKDAVLFIYDTGAFITVLNRDRYDYFKLYQLPRQKLHYMVMRVGLWDIYIRFRVYILVNA